MQHDRKRWSDVDEFFINLYMVARPRLRAEVCANSAVDCDATCSDQLIAMPTRTKTGSSKETVETHLSK
jgi:hypothetical protein